MSEEYPKPEDSVVNIYLSSGIVVAPERVVTCLHVIQHNIDRKTPIYVSIRPGLPSYEARVIRAEAQHDLALLEVPGLSAPPVKFSKILPKINDKVLAIGMPGSILTQCTGEIAHLNPADDGVTIPLTTAPFYQGYSGGGLFNTKGELVGITAFAGGGVLPLSWVHNLLQRTDHDLTQSIPDTDVTYLEWAFARHKDGKPLELLQQWTESHPNSYLAQLRLSNVASLEEQWQLSYDAAKTAYQLFPSREAKKLGVQAAKQIGCVDEFKQFLRSYSPSTSFIE